MNLLFDYPHRLSFRELSTFSSRYCSSSLSGNFFLVVSGTPCSLLVFLLPLFCSFFISFAGYSFLAQP